MDVQERYNGIAMAANGTATFQNIVNIAGFYGKAGGNITITDGPERPGATPVVIVNAAPVVTGWNRLPFKMQNPGSVVTLDTNAAGTLAIW